MHKGHACRQAGFILLWIIVGVVLALLGAGTIYYGVKVFSNKPQIVPKVEQKRCTLEAMICPDGSSVGREGPNCEFAACPISDAETACLEPLPISINYPTNSSTRFFKRNAVCFFELKIDEATIYIGPNGTDAEWDPFAGVEYGREEKQVSFKIGEQIVNGIERVYPNGTSNIYLENASGYDFALQIRNSDAQYRQNILDMLATFSLK